ncbi:MAG: PD-(D/E)XK nuclease family protein [Cyanobacteria bacterium J06597_1]
MGQIPQRITQSHLRLLDSEPHRFARLYTDGLEPPTVARNSAAIERGKQFHQLLHQQSLGLPIASLVDGDPDLKRYFQAFQTCPPPLLEGNRLAEYALALPWGDFQLYGIVDLLVETGEVVEADDRAQIVDWKTYWRSRSFEELVNDWQTRLYLFLLTEARGYVPERVSMLYWFAEDPQHCIEISYSSKAHRNTRTDLAKLLDALAGWLQSGFPDPSIAENSKFDPRSIADIPPLPLP